MTLFVSGCTNHCENCFQPKTWDFYYGKPFTNEVSDYILDLLLPDYISGLTLLGGEPFEPKNQRALLPLLQKVKERYPEKNVWAFSGFTIEELINPGAYCHTNITKDMLSMIDVLVDGRYIDHLRDISLRFRGSSNQRLIDVQKTMHTGILSTLEDDIKYNEKRFAK